MWSRTSSIQRLVALLVLSEVSFVPLRGDIHFIRPGIHHVNGTRALSVSGNFSGNLRPQPKPVFFESSSLLVSHLVFCRSLQLRFLGALVTKLIPSLRAGKQTGGCVDALKIFEKRSEMFLFAIAKDLRPRTLGLAVGLDFGHDL